MYDNRLFQLRSLNWRWLVLSYCFLILFHLFPSVVIVGGARTDTEFLLHTRAVAWPMVVWMVVGILAVSCYVGYRSRSVTIMEPGLASLLYLATLLLTMSNFGGVNTSHEFIILTLWIVLMHLLAFLVGCAGATVGEWLQMRKEKKQMA